jgi:26S proteasome regulatory subunit (ATPase 3-interacting protein)
MVYHALQDPKDAASMDDLAALDRDIHELQEKVATARAQEKLLRANLMAVHATVSAEDLRANVITLESEKQEALCRLDSLRAGTVKPVSAQEQDEVEKAWKGWVKKANSRKKICMELWDFCTEEMEEGQTKQDLWVRSLGGGQG